MDLAKERKNRKGIFGPNIHDIASQKKANHYNSFKMKIQEPKKFGHKKLHILTTFMLSA